MPTVSAPRADPYLPRGIFHERLGWRMRSFPGWSEKLSDTSPQVARPSAGRVGSLLHRAPPRTLRTYLLRPYRARPTWEAITFPSRMGSCVGTDCVRP